MVAAFGGFIVQIFRVARRIRRWGWQFALLHGVLFFFAIRVQLPFRCLGLIPRTGFLPDSCGLSAFGVLPYQRLQPVVDLLFRVRLFPVYQRSDLRSSGGSLLFSARPVHADEGVREFPRILQRGEKKGGGILGGMGGVLFGCDPWFLFLSGLGGGRLVPTIGPIQQFFPQVVVPLLIDGGSSLSSRNP